MSTRLPEKLLEHARSLRIHQTNAENLLWMLLRGRQLGGYKFRRQHPVDIYIVDFYCNKVALAVELDGGQHNAEVAVRHDEHRSKVLREAGIHIIRFWNHEVLTSTEAVLEKIYLELMESEALPHPCPSPRGRGENDRAGMS